MTPAAPSVGGDERDPGGFALVVLYVVGWIAGLLPIGLLTVGLIAGAEVAAHGLDGALATVQELVAGGGKEIPTWALVATLAVQFPVMVGLVPLSHALVGRFWYRPRDPSRARPEGWRGVFGLRPAPAAFFGLAVLMGLTIGVLPGWIAQQIRALIPSLGEGMIDQINGALASGPVGWRAAFVLEIAVGAPLVEELVFRGFMWEALRRSMPTVAVWVTTSLVFAAYHMDPVQAVALILTSLGLGWLRWMSGSVWPGVVLHGVNNGLGVTAALLTGQADADTPLALALAGATVAGAAAYGAARVRLGHGGRLGDDAPVG